MMTITLSIQLKKKKISNTTPDRFSFASEYIDKFPFFYACKYLIQEIMLNVHVLVLVIAAETTIIQQYVNLAKDNINCVAVSNNTEKMKGNKI